MIFAYYIDSSVLFGPKVRGLGPKCDKSGSFCCFDHIMVHRLQLWNINHGSLRFTMNLGADTLPLTR